MSIMVHEADSPRNIETQLEEGQEVAIRLGGSPALCLATVARLGKNHADVRMKADVTICIGRGWFGKQSDSITYKKEELVRNVPLRNVFEPWMASKKSPRERARTSEHYPEYLSQRSILKILRDFFKANWLDCLGFGSIALIGIIGLFAGKLH